MNVRVVHHVHARRVPRPPGLDEAAEDIYTRLMEVASLETMKVERLVVRLVEQKVDYLAVTTGIQLVDL